MTQKTLKFQNDATSWYLFSQVIIFIRRGYRENFGISGVL